MSEKSIRETVTDEWHSRTWYGKLWYPLWVVSYISLIIAIALIMVVWQPAEVAKGIANFLRGYVAKPITDELRGYGIKPPSTPDVYKENND